MSHEKSVQDRLADTLKEYTEANKTPPQCLAITTAFAVDIAFGLGGEYQKAYEAGQAEGVAKKTYAGLPIEIDNTVNEFEFRGASA